MYLFMFIDMFIDIFIYFAGAGEHQLLKKEVSSRTKTSKERRNVTTPKYHALGASERIEAAWGKAPLRPGSRWGCGKESFHFGGGSCGLFCKYLDQPSAPPAGNSI